MCTFKVENLFRKALVSSLSFSLNAVSGVMLSRFCHRNKLSSRNTATNRSPEPVAAFLLAKMLRGYRPLLTSCREIVHHSCLLDKYRTTANWLCYHKANNPATSTNKLGFCTNKTKTDNVLISKGAGRRILLPLDRARLAFAFQSLC